MTNTRGRQARLGSTGFTLIELMITVAIIGVLAVLAGIGYSSYIRSSKTAEATAMLGAIRSAEETYRTDKMVYLGTNSGTTSIATRFPAGAPTDGKVPWDTTGCIAANTVCGAFRKLGVSADSQVYYRYGVLAGPADGGAHSFTSTASGAGGAVVSTYAVANDPWYYIGALGDLNNNGLQSEYITSSFNTTTIAINPGE